jgi:hypothetical protein
MSYWTLSNIQHFVEKTVVKFPANITGRESQIWFTPQGSIVMETLLCGSWAEKTLPTLIQALRPKNTRTGNYHLAEIILRG